MTPEGKRFGRYRSICEKNIKDFLCENEQQWEQSPVLADMLNKLRFT